MRLELAAEDAENTFFEGQPDDLSDLEDSTHSASVIKQDVTSQGDDALLPSAVPTAVKEASRSAPQPEKQAKEADNAFDDDIDAMLAAEEEVSRAAVLSRQAAIITTSLAVVSTRP